VLRLSFHNSAMKGYLVSCGVPKNKQRKQIICLACVGKLMGKLRVGADAQSVTLCERGHDQRDELMFERLPSGSWRQRLELTDELLEAVVIANERTVSPKRPKKAAADTQRGLQAGKRPRADPVSAACRAYFSLGSMCILTACRKPTTEYAATAARGGKICKLSLMQLMQSSSAVQNSLCTSWN
jgi:hypothetical protein